MHIVLSKILHDDTDWPSVWLKADELILCTELMEVHIPMLIPLLHILPIGFQIINSFKYAGRV